MIIKKIKVLKNKVVITFEDRKLELDKEIYTNFYLYEGKDVSVKEFNKINEYNNISALLKYALRIRAKSIYSEYQLREKLYAKGGLKPEVDQVIISMKNYDLIDDNAFIADHIEYYNSLNYGKNKIIKKLSDKGIFEDKLEKINFPISIERKKAKNILNKTIKKYEKYNYSQLKNHVYASYISNGFSNEIASEMVSLIPEPKNNKDELEKLKKEFDKQYTRLIRKYQKKELKQKLITSLLSKGYKMNDIMKLIERKSL